MNKSNNLEIIVTGSSRGIGKYICLHLLDRGFKVIGISRTSHSIDNKNFFHIKADLTDNDDIDNLKLKIDSFQNIYGLINNAGTASLNHFLLTTVKRTEKVLKLNLNATFIMSQIAVKKMIPLKKGRIINFSSVAVPLGLEGEAIYASSKSAIESFSEVISKEIAVYGITSNCIGPNPIDTALIKSVPKKKIQQLLERQAIKRLGQFKDITNIVDFYLNENSSFITGQKIYLGGIHS